MSPFFPQNDLEVGKETRKQPGFQTIEMFEVFALIQKSNRVFNESGCKTSVSVASSAAAREVYLQEHAWKIGDISLEHFYVCVYY